MKEKVQILLAGTLPSFVGSRNYGGVAKVVWAQAKAMAEKQVDFAVLGLGKYYGGWKIIEGVEIHGVKFHAGTLIKLFRTVITHKNAFRGMDNKDRLRLFYAFYTLLFISTKSSFEFIHVHHIYNQIPIAAKLLFPNTPVFATIHSYSEAVYAPSSKRRQNIIANYNRQLQLIDAISHVSKSVREQGRSLGVQWSCKDIVIYNGTNFPFERFEAFDATPQNPGQLVFSGSLIAQKGVWKLLEAVKILESTVTELTMAGNGALHAEILSAAKKNNLNVKLVGYLSDHLEVFSLMAGARGFVLPSISESFGLVYIEAILAGTPIVGYHAMIEEFNQLFDLKGRARDWLIPFNYEIETSAQLAEKITRSFEVKSRFDYQETRALLRNKIITHFSWSTIAESYLHIYREIQKGGTNA